MPLDNRGLVGHHGIRNIESFRSLAVLDRHYLARETVGGFVAAEECADGDIDRSRNWKEGGAGGLDT